MSHRDFLTVPEKVRAQVKKNKIKQSRREERAAGRQVLPVGVPEERLKNLSCLSPSFCFLFHFVHSALNSLPFSSSSSSFFLFCACYRTPSLPFLTPLPPQPPLPIFGNASSTLPPTSSLAVNVCDEEMLLCQNGGTCYQNQKCMCPPEFKGVLCQHSRCEAGKECNAASSYRLNVVVLLLCALLAHMLPTLTPH